jgi:hypothetical protein
LKVRGCQDQICSGLTREFVNVVHIKAQESNCGRVSGEILPKR